MFFVRFFLFQEIFRAETTALYLFLSLVYFVGGGLGTSSAQPLGDLTLPSCHQLSHHCRGEEAGCSHNDAHGQRELC